MRAISISQKWPKIAKMTPDDLLSLTMISSEPLGNTEKTFFEFSKFVINVEIERQNDFDDSHGMYDPYYMAHIT